jgi:hypothetical protein
VDVGVKAGVGVDVGVGTGLLPAGGVTGGVEESLPPPPPHADKATSKVMLVKKRSARMATPCELCVMFFSLIAF